MPSPLTSVVVPVFNEAGNIEPCLRGLWASLSEIEHEILVCYDFEEDNTLAAIAAMPDAPPSLRLVRNDLGRGAAFALRAGFAAARGDVVVVTMADLSDPPEPIPEMARRVREEHLAVVCGSRYMSGGSQTGGPLIKSTLSRLACLALRWVAGMGTHDATNNFKAYSASFLAGTEIQSTHAFDIALELATKAHLAGAGVGQVPSSWVDRSAGDSRFRVWAWMPSYLRWWLRAMAAPLVVWAAFVASPLWIIKWGTHPDWGGETPLGVAVAIYTVMAGIGALLVRHRRGRMVVADALIPILALLLGADRTLLGTALPLPVVALILGVACLALSALGRRAPRT